MNIKHLLVATRGWVRHRLDNLEAVTNIQIAQANNLTHNTHGRLAALEAVTHKTHQSELTCLRDEIDLLRRRLTALEERPDSVSKTPAETMADQANLLDAHQDEIDRHERMIASLGHLLQEERASRIAEDAAVLRRCLKESGDSSTDPSSQEPKPKRRRAKKTEDG